MSESPKVSIIIDNYNYAQYVAEAVESALAQTYPNCEVIVVDDGSTDNSRDVLQHYASQVQLICQPNAGQAAAFNTGFRHCSGDLILFLDSDDRLHLRAMQTLVAAWKPQYSKIQFPLAVIDGDGIATGMTMPSNRLSEGNVLPSLLAKGRYMTAPTSGNLYSRAFLNTVMPMPEREWSQGNDSYLNTVAGFAGPVGAIDYPLGNYRVHGESMSTILYRGQINLVQIEKLITHGERQQALVKRLAEERTLACRPNGLNSHWLQLKLVLTRQKLSSRSLRDWQHLLANCWRFVRSVMTDAEVRPLRRIQLAGWALSSTLAPARFAEVVLAFGFEFIPGSRFSRILRQSWQRSQKSSAASA